MSIQPYDAPQDIVVSPQEGVAMHGHDLLPPIMVLVQAQSLEGTAGKFRRLDTGEEYAALRMVPVRVQATRTRMPGEFNRESRPLCWSNDGLHPAPGGDQHGEVERCVDCVFYTAVPWNAAPDDCKADYAALLIAAGTWEPFLMRLRGTASRNARIMGAKGVFRTAWLSLRSELVTNDKGKWFSTIISTDARLSQEDLAMVQTVMAGGVEAANLDVRPDEPLGGTLPAPAPGLSEEPADPPVVAGFPTPPGVVSPRQARQRRSVV